MYYVYAHINPVTLKPFYIGKGRDERANSTLGRNPFWHNTVNKYGFGVLKLVDGLNNEQACEIEKQYIKKYGLRIEGGCLVNLTYGGSGGNTVTENNRDSHRENSSIAKRGSKNPNFGKSTWILGKHLPEHQKQRLREFRTGKKHSPETKIKVLKGLEKAVKSKLAKRYKVECLITGKIWENRIECMNDLGISLALVKQRIWLGKKLKYLK